MVPWRKADLLALPGVGPALGEILVNVFESWEADDAALSTSLLATPTAGLGKTSLLADGSEVGGINGLGDGDDNATHHRANSRGVAGDSGASVNNYAAAAVLLKDEEEGKRKEGFLSPGGGGSSMERGVGDVAVVVPAAAAASAVDVNGESKRRENRGAVET